MSKAEQMPHVMVRYVIPGGGAKDGGEAVRLTFTPGRNAGKQGAVRSRIS